MGCSLLLVACCLLSDVCCLLLVSRAPKAEFWPHFGTRTKDFATKLFGDKLAEAPKLSFLGQSLQQNTAIFVVFCMLQFKKLIFTDYFFSPQRQKTSYNIAFFHFSQWYVKICFQLCRETSINTMVSTCFDFTLNLSMFPQTVW